jgi:phytoene synthase
MEINQAHAAAAAYANRRGPIMRVISKLFTPEHRRAANAVYAFFRTADDLVDEGNLSLEQFRAWREQAQQPIEQQTDPFIIAWTDVRARYNIPLAYEKATLDGLELDLTCHRYETMDELKKYCYGVAVAPFLITMSIVGFRAGVTVEQAKPYMEHIGVAMQLTDILMDMDEDLSVGRIYLPNSELAAFGLTFADIEAKHFDERFEQFISHFTTLIRDNFIAGWPVLDLMNNTIRLGLGMGFVLYRTFRDEIDAHGLIFVERKSFGSKIFWLLATKWPAIYWTKSADKYFR